MFSKSHPTLEFTPTAEPETRLHEVKTSQSNLNIFSVVPSNLLVYFQ